MSRINAGLEHYSQSRCARRGGPWALGALLGSGLALFALSGCHSCPCTAKPAPAATPCPGQSLSPTPPIPPPPAQPAPNDSRPAPAPPSSAPSDPSLGKAPLGADGEPLLPDAELKFAEGTGCNPEIAAGRSCGGSVPAARMSFGHDPRERQECAIFELQRCSEQCEGYASSSFECVRGSWKAAASSNPPCACTPKAPPPALAQCATRLLRVKPGPKTPLDTCELVLHCASDDILAECDAEEDGTGTSLCSCWKNRKAVRLPKALFRSEGPDACFEAAALCKAAK